MGCGERICLLFATSGQTVTWAPGFPPGNQGGRGEGKQALASSARQLRCGVSGPGPSLFSSRATAPHCVNREGFGCKGGPRRTREAKGGRSDEGPPLRRWNRRQGEEELIPGAHQAAPPARYLVLELAVPAQSQLRLFGLRPCCSQAGCWEGGTQRAMRSRGTREGLVEESSAPPRPRPPGPGRGQWGSSAPPRPPQPGRG